MLWIDEEQAIRAVQEYWYNLRRPVKGRIERRSYAKWAAGEVYIYIISHHDMTPKEAVEDFIKFVDESIDKRCENLNTRAMFMVARDVAFDILDILRAME